jgi:hypothetical protein
VRAQFLNHRENVLGLTAVERGTVREGTLEYDAAKEAQRICEQLLEIYGDKIDKEHLINIATEIITDIAEDGKATDLLSPENYGKPIEEDVLHEAVRQYYDIRLENKVAVPVARQNRNPIAAAVAAAASVTKSAVDAARRVLTTPTAPPAPGTPATVAESVRVESA